MPADVAKGRLMFTVSRDAAQTIRGIYREKGECAAIDATRRLFPALRESAGIATAVRIIVGWHPESETEVVDAEIRPEGESADE